MIIPFSNIRRRAPVISDPFADAPDGSGVAADSADFRTSSDATPSLRPTYNFHDISVSGTELGTLAGGDDVTAVYNLLGFAFPYYGVTKSAIRVNTNGMISFAGTGPVLPSNWTPAPSAPPAVNTLPSADDPNDLIAPLMKDYKANHVYVKEVTSPKRLIIQWDCYDFYTNDATRHDIFQCVLHEDGAIYFYYNRIDSDVSGANDHIAHTGVGWDVSPFIYGCQNSDHTAGVFIGGNSPSNDVGLVGQLLAVNMAIRIKPRT